MKARCPRPPPRSAGGAGAASRATSTAGDWQSTASHHHSKASQIRDRLAANIKMSKSDGRTDQDGTATSAVDPLGVGGFAADVRRRASVPDAALESTVLQRRRPSAMSSPDLDEYGASPDLGDDRSSVYTVPIWSPETDPASPTFKNPFPVPTLSSGKLRPFEVPAIPVRASSYLSTTSTMMTTKSGLRKDADETMRIMFRDHHETSARYPPRDIDVAFDLGVPATAVPPPFAHEITLVLSTFFSPLSSRELNLDDRLRTSVLRSVHPDPSDPSLWGTTHPDVFQEADAMVVRLMESSSLRGFLAWSTGNTNPSKRRFWYLIGAADFSLGLLISLVLFAFVHARYWRILGLPFIAFGSMQLFSAAKNFCSVVHGRGARQLTPWELSEQPAQGLSSVPTSPMTPFASSPADDSPASSWSAELGADPMIRSRSTLSAAAPTTPTLTLREQCPFLFEDAFSAPPSPTMTRSSAGRAATRARTPSLLEGIRKRLTNESETSRWSRLKQRQSPRLGARQRRRSSLAEVKVPTFGPETLIEDPAVITLQANLIKKILVVGVIGTVVFGAILLGLPQRN